MLRPALMLRMSACAPTCRWGPFYKPHPFKHLVPRVLCSPAPCGHGFEILETQNSSKSLWGGDSCWKEAGEGRSWAFSPPDSERFRCPDQAGGAVLPLSPTPRPPPLTSPSAWATGNKQTQGEPREGRPGGSVGKPEADLPRPPRLGLPLPVSTHRPLPGPPRGAALGPRRTAVLLCSMCWGIHTAQSEANFISVNSKSELDCTCGVTQPKVSPQTEMCRRLGRPVCVTGPSCRPGSNPSDRPAGRGGQLPSGPGL